MAVLQQTHGDMTIYIETTDEEPAVVAPAIVAVDEDEGQAAGAGAKAAEAVDKLKELGVTIGNTCRSLYDTTRGVLESHAPNEFTLEFGVKLAGKAGIPMVTEGSAEATVKVTAKWVKK